MNRTGIATVLAILAMHTPCQAALAQTFQAKCEALAGGGAVGTITQAKFIAAGSLNFPGPPPISLGAPDHCLIQGALAPHVGIDGKPYAIGYELRLPANWNGKFVFQGGGGSDGVLRPAIGVQATGEISALAKGYAIASTDAGHRDEPGPIGPYMFGLDPQARIDKGYNHIPVVTAQAEELIRALYGKPRSRAYFVGCSNGGRQGMAATQRYPQLFDGVIAGAPAYRVPLAAIEAMAEVQTLAAVAPKGADGKPDLGAAISMDDLKLVAAKITELCDAADGLADGLVNNVKACKFDPLALACPAGQTGNCLAPEKAKAIDRVFKGARLGNGEVLYSDWPYDPGIANPGWTAWKIGNRRQGAAGCPQRVADPGLGGLLFLDPAGKGHRPLRLHAEVRYRSRRQGGGRGVAAVPGSPVDRSKRPPPPTSPPSRRMAARSSSITAWRIRFSPRTTRWPISTRWPNGSDPRTISPGFTWCPA